MVYKEEKASVVSNKIKIVQMQRSSEIAKSMGGGDLVA